MAISFVAQGAPTYDAADPNVVLPAGIQAGDLIILIVGTKPDTAGPASATGFTNLGAATGGAGTLQADNGPTRTGILYKEAVGDESSTTVSVAMPNNNITYALAWVLRKGGTEFWATPVLASGVDTTGASAAYAATATSNPGVTAGDYVLAACTIPTDVGTAALGSALTNNLTQTGVTFSASPNTSGYMETGTGFDLAGHVRGVLVSSGTGTANPVYTVTFTGATNTYGAAAFARFRVATPTPKAGSDTATAVDSASVQEVFPRVAPTFPDAKDLVEGSGNRNFAAVTTQAGDYLVFEAIIEDGQYTVTPSASGLTFTKRTDGSGLAGAAVGITQWTALDATGGVRTVQAGPSLLTAWYRARLTVVRGSDGHGTGSISDNANQLVTTARQSEQSAMFMAVGDWTAGAVGSPSWTPGGTTVASQQGSRATYIFGRQDDAGAAGTDSTGITSPSYISPSISVLEMRGVESGPPAFGSVGTHTAGVGATISVPVPAGVAANDIIVIPMYIDGPTVTITGLPAGFTHADQSPVTAFQSAGTISHRLAVVWKRATGNDVGTYDFTLSASAYRAAGAVRYTHCITTGSPWDSPADAGNDPTGASSTVSPPVDVTTAGLDRMLVFAASNWAGGGWTPPTGFTERLDAGDRVHTLADDVQTAAGSSGSITATCVGNDKRAAWLGALIGMTPGGSSPPTNVAGSDTSAMVDAGTMAVTLTPATDARTATDAGTLATTLTPATDTSSMVDAATLTTLTPKSGSDTALMVDAGTLLASFTGTDLGGSADAPSGPLSAILTGAEAPGTVEAYQLSVVLQSADTGAQTDAGSVTQGGTDKSGSETTTAVDAATLAASQTRADTAGAADVATLVVNFTASDLSSIVDTVQALAAAHQGAETSSQAEGQTLNAGGNVSGGDTSSVIEGRTLTVSLTGADTSTTTDNQTVLPTIPQSGSDTGSTVENRTLTVQLTASEIVAAIEGFSLSAGGNPAGADTSTVQESILLTVSVSRGDTVTSIDQGFLTLLKSGAETSTLVESAALLAQLTVDQIVAAAEVLAVLTGPQTWNFLSADVRAITTGAEATTNAQTVEFDGGSEQTTEYSNGTRISLNITW